MPAVTGVGVMTILNKVLGAVGVVLLLAGVALGFRSVSSSGANCGSAFRTAAGITPMTCDSALNSAGTLVTVVIGIGVVFLAAAFTVTRLQARTGS
ncbi:hypothetical protein HPO96_06375 [Kribbella sandramycini]|uniref:Uncharacterized protein n=2 Tax=Kribbella sandramycini TaxID=60450 RepID=A0A7Y4KWH3_9ACTN|nr:hypothetical protein [Kribbella sandramycini]